MRRALTTFALAVGVTGALAVLSTPSMAQVAAVEVAPPAYGYGAYGGPYGAYDVGPAYGYYSPTHGIYGGPPGNLFDYSGPNHGAMVRETQ